jgi:uncharacterized membrane protein
MKKTSLVVYAILGAGALLYGVAALFFPSFLLPEARESPLLTHILREQGASAIFIGLMGLWCIFHYEQRRAVHYFLALFAFLLAGIHWFDFVEGRRPLVSGLINSVPFLVLGALAIFLPRSDNRRSV